MADSLTFTPGDASAPNGSTVPTAREVQAMGIIGLDLTWTGRATLMNQIGGALQIPPGGWHGQSKLFEGSDIRLVALLRKLANEHHAKHIAGNLARAGRFARVDIMLALATTAREHHKALTATGDHLINSYREGGLDYLWDEKEKLGLPKAVTKPWVRVRPFVNPETHHEVHPARIPAHDQLMIYAAQIGASFFIDFKRNLTIEFRGQAEPALLRASRLATLVWQAYAFLAPGGDPFDRKKALSLQLGQSFGSRSALGYVAYRAREAGSQPDLDQVLKDMSLNHTAWVHSAKTRVAETLFLERLLKRARELLL